MTPREQRALLSEAGFRLVRQGKSHEIWHGPDGQIQYVTRGRKSDPRGERNLRASLRRGA